VQAVTHGLYLSISTPVKRLKQGQNKEINAKQPYT